MNNLQIPDPQNRPDLTWQIGDKIKFVMHEFTEYQDGIKQDAWIGDTGTIIEISKQHFCEEDDFTIWFQIQIDESCMNDNRDRWCNIATADIHNAINLDRLYWAMNPDYTGKPINIDWAALAITLEITIVELNEYWNNGSIFVFDGLDTICNHYQELELDTPAADLLKEEIKDGSVIYTQHLFFMWA
ncbi:MAG: hypothetical protein ACO23H_09850 [Alphaproteobacteria bacterium]